MAQLASDHAAIDWSVNCGNMSSALQMWALDSGLVEIDGTPGVHEMNIRNTNTGVITRSRMTRDSDGRFVEAEIPGVLGAYPAVDLFLQNPVASKTGRLLPTGNPRDTIERISVSCVDVAVPMVIVAAADLGKTAHEPIAELEADATFMAILRHLWVEAGLKMALKRRDGELMTADELGRSQTIPKICIIGGPQSGGNLAVRYFTPQTGHASMAVSGGCCLAAATLIPGSVAHGIARNVAKPGAGFSDIEVGIENPAGILDTTIVARIEGGMPIIASAAYRRSAQVLVRGKLPLYRASQDHASLG